MAIVIWKGTASGHEGDWDFDDAGNSYADSNISQRRPRLAAITRKVTNAQSR